MSTTTTHVSNDKNAKKRDKSQCSSFAWSVVVPSKIPVTKSGLHEVVYGEPKCRRWHHVGISFEPIPHLPLPPVQGELPWFWFPWRLRLLSPLTVRVVAGLCAFASVVLFTSLYAVNAAGAWAALVLLNLLFTLPLCYVTHVMLWNFRLREGICYTLGKAAQAREVFKSDPRQPKHVYFAWKVAHGFRLVVLNDGTSELWNTGGTELARDVNEALGQAGFVVQVGNAKNHVVPDLSIIDMSVERSPVEAAEAQMPTPDAAADLADDVHIV